MRVPCRTLDAIADNICSSISQDHSLSPFNIDEESMCRLLRNHHVPPDFVDVMFSFGDKKATSGEAPGSVVYRSINERSLGSSPIDLRPISDLIIVSCD
jgi:hypothetical protein